MEVADLGLFARTLSQAEGSTYSQMGSELGHTGHITSHQYGWTAFDQVTYVTKR